MKQRQESLRRVGGETALEIPCVKTAFQPHSNQKCRLLFSIVSAGLRARSWLLADLLGKRLECGQLLLLIEGQSKQFRSKQGSSLDAFFLPLLRESGQAQDAPAFSRSRDGRFSPAVGTRKQGKASFGARLYLMVMGLGPESHALGSPGPFQQQ